MSYVRSDSVIGLGTGSTAAFAVDRLGDLLASGALSGVRGVPTSVRTLEQAVSRGIPVDTLDGAPCLSVAIDGADEVDLSTLDVVKGRGGALLREKMVERAAELFVCIVDESKVVEGLGGSTLAVPVEIVRFCHVHTARRVLDAAAQHAGPGNAARLVLRGAGPGAGLPDAAGGGVEIRRDALPRGGEGDAAEGLYVTDNGNLIADLFFQGPVADPAALADAIAAVEGVVEHGLFLGMVDVCIVAGKNGISVHERKRI